MIKKLSILLCFTVNFGISGRAFDLGEMPQKSWFPDNTKLQFAGNIGFFSVSAGYIFLKSHIEMDFFYGFTPKTVAGTGLHTISYKANIIPFEFPIFRDYHLVPVTLGSSINTTYGENLDIILPTRFRSYYFPSGVTYSIYMGYRISRWVGRGNNQKQITFYNELTGLGHHVITCFRNESISFREITSINFGVALGW